MNPMIMLIKYPAVIACLAALSASAQDIQPPSNYRLAPSDLISVNVFQEPDLTTTARLADDGTVSLPLIGLVNLAGSSVKDAMERIAALYARDYLVNPVVTLSVTQITKAKVMVLGPVGKPGMIELPTNEGIPVLEAIALAGGFTRLANQSKITIKRKGVSEVIKVNGKEQAKSGTTSAVRVIDGDIINVAESIF